MSRRVILFGATGHLGREIARVLVRQQYVVSAVVRDKQKSKGLLPTECNLVSIPDLNETSLRGVCAKKDIVISALGKSVSIKDNSKQSFHDIDFGLNSIILKEAMLSSVGKFVYVSAYGVENHPELEYCRAHHDFSELLKKSGLNYSVIKPVAIFSAFIDLIDAAKKNQLFNLGKGDKRTNPIFEGDLAEICVKSIDQKNAIVEAGGVHVYTRKQIVQIIQETVKPGKKVRSVPVGLAKFLMPILKLTNRNLYDKFAFFLEMLEHDVLAPRIGSMRLEDYIQKKITSS
jgi:uncharacterized protein YbjT (DUF2867 family)